MKVPSIPDVAEKLNELAKGHPIGELQARRSRPNNSLFMVNSKSVTKYWAYHWGGRKELQFNIGVEDSYLRHGVAFSFKDTREYKYDHLLTVLHPRVQRFNAFMRKHSRMYSDMQLSIWDPQKSDSVFDGKPQPIPLKLLRQGSFVFLGKVEQRLTNIDYESVLRDLDRLFHLYKYVERVGKPISLSERDFRFCVGDGQSALSLPSTTYSATRTRAEDQRRIMLRHNKLTRALFFRLRKKYGTDCVHCNCPTQNGTGTLIDILVMRGRERWVYEIKVGENARQCIREALGQILEYAYWPGGLRATRLIIVGEPPIQKHEKAYLGWLRKEFGLPLAYERILVR